MIGTSTSTSNEHTPPVRVRSDTPESEDPTPQGKAGRLIAIRPEITSSRSSENERSVAVAEPGLVMVKVRVTVPVGGVGPSNDLVKSSS